MRLFHDSGIMVSDGDAFLSLDADKRMKTVDFVGITHAHADHMRSHDSPVLATAATADFMRDNKVEVMEYGKPKQVKSLTVSVHDAGHIIGSSQFRIENGAVIAYTGDFRLKPSVLFNGCTPIECDKLVIECTYGLPHYQFPSVEDVVSEMSSWLHENEGKNVIFGSYSLGKPQEIIKMLNKEGVTPVVHPAIARTSQVYVNNGIELSFFNSQTPEGADAMKEAFVGVVPTKLLSKRLFKVISGQNRKPTVSAIATGWGVDYGFRGTDRVFILSDHADFSQLIEYVERSGASEVFTVHGYERQFAAALREKGYKARPLKSANTLLDW